MLKVDNHAQIDAGNSITYYTHGGTSNIQHYVPEGDNRYAIRQAILNTDILLEAREQGIQIITWIAILSITPLQRKTRSR